jgi:hypothetical protein
MSEERENPYRPLTIEPEPTAPSWEFVWTVALLGAALGLLAILVSSGGELTWLLAWPFVPVASVAGERWRRRKHA